MTYFSLRKQTSEPDPAGTEELEDSEAIEETPDDQADADEGEIPSPPRAFVIAIRDWFTWCSNLIGTTATYTVHVVAVWAAGHYDNSWILYGVTIGLVLAVGTFLPRPTIDHAVTRIEQLSQRPAKASNQPAVEAPAQDSADPLIGLLWHLISDAPGVHLKTLTAVLAETAERGGGAAPSRADVKAALEARSIPLRPSVRDTRDKVNRGVHRDDLTAALQTPSPVNVPDP
jgi:hypothetical protein